MGKLLKELSIFIDESGSQGGHSKYILVTILLHMQNNKIEKEIMEYKLCLRHNLLPDIPFHASPLMNGHGDYEGMELSQRKKMFSIFEAFVRKLPFGYKTFIYKRDEIGSVDKFIVRLKRDLINFIADNLSVFQNFDTVKIYYDDAQQMITKALHSAIDFMLSAHSVVYKMARASEYALFQTADCICSIELVDIKFQNNELTKTDIKFFGTKYRNFKLNHLKKFRRKAI